MNFKLVYNYPTFTDQILETIQNSHQKVIFKKGEFILKEGKIAREYLCIENGIARAFAVDYNGNEITTNFITTNQIIIEPYSLFLGKKTKENIQALSDCICWKLSFDNFQELFQNIPGFSDWGRLYMTQELVNLKDKSISMITNSAKDRYIEFQKSNPNIALSAPLKHIASYLGITDSTLSKIRREISQS